jgi:perosamine synthetase
MPPVGIMMGMIPHSRPTMGPEDVDAVAGVLRSGCLAQGEQVRRFEDAIAAFLGRRGAVATSSGTSALHLALLVLGVGPRDEVLMPSYTCVAPLHAVRYVKATPRLVEIDRATYNLSPRHAERLLTRRTKAVIVPHMFGLSADLAPMAAWDVPLIEDCAQAFGATYSGRPVGSTGTVSVCSFYATKVLTTGEGGMLLSDSETILQQARDLRDYDGRTTLVTRFNYKMTDMQAALGLSQLRQLPAFLARRRALAARYAGGLQGLPLRLPTVPPGRTHIFFRYVVGVRNAARLVERLALRGIESKPPVFQPMHRYLGAEGFAQTDEAMQTAFSLPIYPSLTDSDADAVVAALRDAIGRPDYSLEEEYPHVASPLPS